MTYDFVKENYNQEQLTKWYSTRRLDLTETLFTAKCQSNDQIDWFLGNNSLVIMADNSYLVSDPLTRNELVQQQR
jgi:hypothetical protein